jgi:hypothetical protein
MKCFQNAFLKVGYVTLAGMMAVSIAVLSACGEQPRWQTDDVTSHETATKGDASRGVTSGRVTGKTFSRGPKGDASRGVTCGRVTGKTFSRGSEDETAPKKTTSIEIGAEEIGNRATIVDQVTLDTDMTLHVGADMESGDLGIIVNTVPDNVTVWEKRLSDGEEDDIQLDAGVYYLIGAGGQKKAVGTVTIDGLPIEDA